MDLILDERLFSYRSCSAQVEGGITSPSSSPQRVILIVRAMSKEMEIDVAILRLPTTFVEMTEAIKASSGI